MSDLERYLIEMTVYQQSWLSKGTIETSHKHPNPAENVQAGGFNAHRVLATSALSKNLFFFLGSISSSMAPETPCFNQLWSAIVLKNVTARKVNSYIRKTCSEYYTVPPGFVFRGVPILLKAPMLVGLEMKKKKILLPFSKPCYGTMLFELDAAAEDFLVLRSALGTGKAKKEPKR